MYSMLQCTQCTQGCNVLLLRFLLLAVKKYVRTWMFFCLPFHHKSIPIFLIGLSRPSQSLFPTRLLYHVVPDINHRPHTSDRCLPLPDLLSYTSLFRCRKRSPTSWRGSRRTYRHQRTRTYRTYSYICAYCPDCRGPPKAHDCRDTVNGRSLKHISRSLRGTEQKISIRRVPTRVQYTPRKLLQEQGRALVGESRLTRVLPRPIQAGAYRGGTYLAAQNLTMTGTPSPNQWHAGEHG